MVTVSDWQQRIRRILANVLFAIAVLSLAGFGMVDAWVQCSEQDGGGICPDYATCCPTGIQGVSSCVSGNRKNPTGAEGQCCDATGTHGCTFGYDCAVASIDNPSREEDKHNKHSHKLQQEEVCLLRDPHPDYLIAKKTPRYKLCRLPPSLETLELQAFPIGGFNATYYSTMGSIVPPPLSLLSGDDNGHNNNDESLSSSSLLEHEHYLQKFSSIETVLVIVHGSGRNADDYLCAGSSVVEEAGEVWNNGDTTKTKTTTSFTDSDSEKVLVIAPKFNANIDHNDRNRHPNTLYWLEQGANVPLCHTWRYGADAANTRDAGGSGSGISSYAVMDHLLEFLIASKHKHKPPMAMAMANDEGRKWSVRGSPRQEEAAGSFYNFHKLKRIVVAGHSAGGQFVHSSSNSSIDADPRGERSVAADADAHAHASASSENNSVDAEVEVEINPTNGNVNEQYSYAFAVPDRMDIEACPGYDQWQWGLQPGGDILAPYKDAALNRVNNDTRAIGLRYAKRRVFYLAGEQDTEVLKSRCEDYTFQGDTRNERARRYFRALTEYFATTSPNDGGRLRHHNERFTSSESTIRDSATTPLIHELSIVPGSPHDHTLMFQSVPAREAFFGNDRNNNNNNNERLD
eukprot:jgi/Psemu1/323364/estExt_fgenesh1_pg.C_680026